MGVIYQLAHVVIPKRQALVISYLGASLRRGRSRIRVLEAMRSSATPTIESIEQFAFGKRVWTRYAPTAKARAAICVQRFDDSLNPAIHITYRVSRRSSSLREPRDPSLKGGCSIRVSVFVRKRLVDGLEKRVLEHAMSLRGLLF